MPCRFPLEAAREIGKGQKPLIYSRGRRPNPLSEGWEALELPCGQCRGCRLEKSRQWGARIAQEAAYLEETFGHYSSFITLTYNEKSLPFGGTLVPEHLQQFLKRLRERLSRKPFERQIRYYASGEYGSTCPQHRIQDCPHCGPVQRPHYHAIILGFDFPDRHHVGDRDGMPVYNSDFLSSVWDFGFHEIGSCSFESAAYVARYIMKKVTGKKASEHYTRYDPWMNTWFEVEPEFARMSRGRTKPGGIGAGWCEKYETDIYDADALPIPGRGVFGLPPDYYDRIFAEKYPEYMEVIKQNRKQKMLNSLETGPSLESRAMVQDSKIQKLGRQL